MPLLFDLLLYPPHCSLLKLDDLVISLWT
jgi:hypothetical protein